MSARKVRLTRRGRCVVDVFWSLFAIVAGITFLVLASWGLSALLGVSGVNGG